MVGGFFPTPYPDECYYSVLCRYFVRSGSTSNKRTIKELFGNAQCLSTSVFFPIRLDCVDIWISPGTGVTRKSITAGHTMYPYMAMMYPPKLRQEMNRVIAGEVPVFDLDFIGTQRSFDLWPKHLRYCPRCTREDIALYGEAYWHRAHQLQGMAYCTKHLVRLADSCMPMRKTTMNFHPASDVITDDNEDRTHDSLAPHKEKFLKIGRESEWLLAHGMSVDWDFDFQAKYKRLLREKDIVTIQGIADYDLIVSRFQEYWGEDFLLSLYSLMSDTRDWIRQIQAARLMSFKPIYHILLMCFLKGSVKAFLECEAPENPFGKGPWPCKNPICAHYQVGECKNTDIRYVNGIATGFFQCNHCGMLYKQIKRKGKTGDVFIVDYGPAWKDKLLRCLGTEKMTVPETAEVLKCNPHIVSWQKKKLGISKEQGYLKSPRRYDPEIGAEAYYKAQVIDVCNRYGEVTFALLREHAPGAYSYFAKHDFSWLRRRMIYERDRIFQKKHDQDLQKTIQNVVEGIKKGGDPKRRLTVGYIASVAGVKESVLRSSAQKRPQTHNVINLREKKAVRIKKAVCFLI